MKILFVINNYYSKGNGLSASARRTVGYLSKDGHEVRILSGANPNQSGPQPYYCLSEFRLPLFSGLVAAQGYSFAKSDDNIIRKAVQWADVVHIEEPFYIQMRAVKIAEELGVPCTATYHLHPENLTASVGMENWSFLNTAILRVWRDFVFDRCSDVQCPTENVRKRLEKNYFRAALHDISNGIIPEEGYHTFHKPDEPFTVACIGRLSREKDQLTLLEAMKYSRFAGQIQLIFAGRGPMEDAYKEESDKLFQKGLLTHRPIFVFCNREKLRLLARKSDLYIHCATIEVEGLSCLEALQQGAVPIIAEGTLTAASQFALDARNRFPERDAKTLADRIDYWLGNDKEREKMVSAYIQSAKKYDINGSIAALEAMFQDAIHRKHSADIV